MAKLRAPVSAAVWLIVALVMIVLVVSPSQVGAALDIFSSKTIEEIKTTKPSDRSDKEWRKLTEDCIKKLDTKVESNPEIKWISELKSIKKEHCYTEKMNSVLEHLIKTKINYSECFETMREYFSLYLDKCGYERHFKKFLGATRTIKPESDDQLSFTDDQTLEKYYIDTLLQKINSYTDKKSTELASITSTIVKISNFASSPNKESYCSQGFKIKEPDSSEDDNADLHLFRKLYLRFYLDKCGFTEAFEKMGENIKEISHGSLYKALYTHLGRKFTTKSNLDWAFRTIGKLSPLGKISKHQCTKEVRELLLDCLIDSSHDASELRKFISKYFAIYLNDCDYESLYRLRIAHMRQTSKEPSLLDEYSTLHIYLMKVLRDSGRKKVVARMNIIRELDAIEDISKMADCTARRLNNLLDRVVESAGSPTFSLITSDYFSLYLEKCGFEAIYKRRIDRMRRSSDYNRELDEFSTLHSYLIVKIRENRKETIVEMMSILGLLADSERISDRAQCTDKWDTFMVAKAFKITEFKHFSLITADFLAHYLEKCGLEESFKKRSDSIQRNLHFKWKSIYPTLFSLIRHHLWKKETLFVILPLIKKLSVLDSGAEKTDCSEELKSELLQTIFTYRGYQSFYKLITNYYDLLSDRCGYSERLKKLVEEGDLSMTKLLDLVFLI